VDMRIEAVLFDLFDTLLLLEPAEAYYESSLRRLHESLVKNGIEVAFEDFSRVYFEVRDKYYSESRESLEEPHFNVRAAQTLQKLGFNLNVSIGLGFSSHPRLLSMKFGMFFREQWKKVESREISPLGCKFKFHPTRFRLGNEVMFGLISRKYRLLPRGNRIACSSNLCLGWND
jgi:hypothetical protein